MNDLYPEDKMVALMGQLERAPNGVDLLQAQIQDYPNDPRLHFLQGSWLAGEGRLIEAHAALSRAVKIAPDFAIARFQLGFFQLTSGESDNAMKTWAPLDALPKEHYLRTFVIGLRHLIRDEFEDCIARLNAGIEANDENEPLNNDMRLIITETTPLLANTQKQGDEPPAPGASQTAPAEESASATSFILNQQGKTQTRH